MSQTTQIITYDLTDLLVALLTGVITGYFSYKLLIHKERNTYTKDKYENVIFPIFQLIEPYLYSKEITPEIISIVSEICICVTKNRMYINGFLLENIDFCKKELDSDKSISQKTFIELCSIISIEYDKSCKKLGISKRSLAYKLNNNQLHPDKRTVLNSVINGTIWFCVLICILSIGYLIFQLITSILNTIGI